MAHAHRELLHGEVGDVFRFNLLSQLPEAPEIGPYQLGVVEEGRDNHQATNFERGKLTNLLGELDYF